MGKVDSNSDMLYACAKFECTARNVAEMGERKFICTSGKSIDTYEVAQADWL